MGTYLTDSHTNFDQMQLQLRRQLKLFGTKALMVQQYRSPVIKITNYYRFSRFRLYNVIFMIYMNRDAHIARSFSSTRNMTHYSVPTCLHYMYYGIQQVKRTRIKFLKPSHNNMVCSVFLYSDLIDDFIT